APRSSLFPYTTLFRSQTRFWAGGVFGGIGAVLLVLFGRPGANILMLLLFLMGLMIFFALTPADVVAFINNMMRRYQAEKEAERAERTAYDTQLFGQQPEEESIENLTGSLPGQPRPAQHPAFDVGPYLEQEEKARRGPAAAAQPAPAAATQPVRPAAPHRAEFDVDLGPDASTKALENAVQHDPLERIEIGPGGTFGLDPLEQLSRRKKQTAPPAPAPAEPEENFELHLEPAPEEEPEVEEADGELDALIGRAMANSPAPSAPGQEVSGEIRLDYPEQDAFATTLQVPAEPPAPPAAVPSIPT